MGKFLNSFKSKVLNTSEKIENFNKINPNNQVSSDYNKNKLNPENKQDLGTPYGTDEEIDNEVINDPNQIDDPYLDDYNYNGNGYNRRGYFDDEVGIQPAQKPESFHHFILENQYKDLERSIRGLKDIWDKDTQTWKTKRKEKHCFTDEEAEDILRTAQSHLATDIKLGWIRKDSFGDYMNAVYKVIAHLFESIAEYRYGRYGDFEVQYDMKLQNHKIFLELWTRIQANYSRSIEGSENKSTHQSVRGQESLQSTDRMMDNRNRINY
jgi:hypothetical protein